MNYLAFLSEVNFVATVVVHTTVFFFALIGYVRTKCKAFAYVASGTGLAVILSSALRLYDYNFPDGDGQTFFYFYRIGFIAAITLYGTGTILLIRRVSCGLKLPSRSVMEEGLAAAVRTRRILLSSRIEDIDILKGMLDEEDIPCEVTNDTVPLPGAEFYPKLWVGDTDFDRASRLLAAFRSRTVSQLERWKCSSCGELLEGQFTSCWKCGATR
jgi:Putative prokaryotic signal transducing protein